MPWTLKVSFLCNHSLNFNNFTCRPIHILWPRALTGPCWGGPRWQTVWQRSNTLHLATLQLGYVNLSGTLTFSLTLSLPSLFGPVDILGWAPSGWMQCGLGWRVTYLGSRRQLQVLYLGSRHPSLYHCRQHLSCPHLMRYIVAFTQFRPRE